MIRLALLFLLIASQSWAAVARDAETTSSCSSCSSLEFFHTTAAGSDRMISVDVAGYHFGGTTVTGITYNAAALTSVGSSTIEDMTVETWRRVAQSTGSNPVAITLSGNAHIVAAPRTFTGVDQTTPFGTVATDANGGSTDLTAAITILADGLGYDAGIQRTNGVCTGVTATGTNQTERYDLCKTGLDANSVGGFGSTNSSVGAADHSYTLTAGGGYIAMLAARINPSAAPPPGTTKRKIQVIVVE
jgi:hypothetical protein